MKLSKWHALEFFAVLGAIASAAGWVFVPPWMLQRKAAGLVGSSESKVKAALGTPFKVITSSAAAAELNWSPTPTRPVSNKALIYLKPPLGVIIYIDKNGTVEQVLKIGT